MEQMEGGIVRFLLTIMRAFLYIDFFFLCSVLYACQLAHKTKVFHLLKLHDINFSEWAP